MSTAADCRERALALLAARPHFRRELEAKLMRRGYLEPEVTAVCEALESRGLLDDRQAARDFAAGRLRRKGFGPLRVRSELVRRGVAQEVVDEVAGETDPEQEREAARTLATRWLAARSFDRLRLARHLQAKGHRRAIIFDLLAEIERESDSGRDFS